MSIAVRLTDDLKKALKSGDKDTLSIIRLIKSAIKNREIEKAAPLSEEEIHGVLLSMVRQGRESIEQFSKGGRHDLADNEAGNITIIQSYLPVQLSRDEIRAIIMGIIDETGAKGQGDIGKVMKGVMLKVKGKAEGKTVSELVRETLNDST
jgi:uncharacterized protein YqeY